MLFSHAEEYTSTFTLGTSASTNTSNMSKVINFTSKSPNLTFELESRATSGEHYITLDAYLLNTNELKHSTTTSTSTIISTTTALTPTTTLIHTLITDHLNSIEKVLDFNTGEVIATSSYSSFGTQVKEGKTNSNRGYTNQQSDQDTTGLNYYNARYQNPTYGIFISSDNNTKDLTSNTVNLLENPQNLNSYSYVRNNPIEYTDPTGNCVWDACVAEAAAWGAVTGAVTSIGVQGLIDAYNGQLSPMSTYATEASIGAGTGAVSVGTGAYYKGLGRLGSEVGVPMLKNGVNLAEQMGEKSYSSFNALKSAVRKEFSVDKSTDLHHIVEQGGFNKTQFSQELLQSTSNIMPIARSAHQKITSFYNRIHNGAGTFRSQVSNKSFSEQYDIGIKQIKSVLNKDI